MHSVSFGCWTPKLRVIVYDNFNQDVYKKWLCFIKRYDLKAKRARNVKVISMGWTKHDGIGMYRRLKRTFKRHKNTIYVDYQGRKWAVSPEAAGTVSFTQLRAPETGRKIVCRLLLLKKKKKNTNSRNLIHILQ
ncbi:hypothetical protein, partial [Salmonella enterica]|uniref:hypothetical protein n=1 Tax=Salmonella enterica TaxID=28901 RepID=UPI0038B95465